MAKSRQQQRSPAKKKPIVYTIHVPPELDKQVRDAMRFAGINKGGIRYFVLLGLSENSAQVISMHRRNDAEAINSYREKFVQWTKTGKLAAAARAE